MMRWLVVGAVVSTGCASRQRVVERPQLPPRVQPLENVLASAEQWPCLQAARKIASNKEPRLGASLHADARARSRRGAHRRSHGAQCARCVRRVVDLSEMPENLASARASAEEFAAISQPHAQ